MATDEQADDAALAEDQWRDAAEAKHRAEKLREDAEARLRRAEEHQAATDKHLDRVTYRGDA